MKRFLVFAGDCYYPDRMNDFQEDFDTLEEAKSFESKIKEKWKSNCEDSKWTEIWDSETRTHV